MNTTEKSIVIVGAGVAGLSVGCYAQMNGYRTQIFNPKSKIESYRSLGTEISRSVIG